MPQAVQAGRSISWFQGRCMTGPDYHGFALTVLITITICALQGIFSFPAIMKYDSSVGVPMLSATAASVLITIISAYLTATTDPGIIPRALRSPPSIKDFPAIRSRAMVYRGRSIIMKYCDTCRIWRPPRTSHCATCNNCVQRFDHHCPWLGNDIGIRNYKTYFCFVVFATISEALGISSSVLTLYLTTDYFRSEFPQQNHGLAIQRALKNGGTSINIAIIVVCFLAFLFTGFLSIFHLHLMIENKTTSECWKHNDRNGSSIVDDYRGLRAIFMILGTSRPASAIREGYHGPSFPGQQNMNTLLDSQVQDQKSKSLNGDLSTVTATPAVSIVVEH